MSKNNFVLHASCVGIGGKAILLLGESGSGKSDLALRLIHEGAQLVSDDYVELSVMPAQAGIHELPLNKSVDPSLRWDDNKILAKPPEKLQGLLEVRGVGIFTLPYISNIPVFLALRLVPREDVERMPEANFFDCHDIKIPLLSLHAFDSSTVAKIHLALRSE